MRNFKSVLLTGAATLLAIAGTAAYAADTDDDDDDEVITVTGTRIQSSGFDMPTPVTRVSAEELDLASPGNIVTALVQLPQFYNSTTTSDPGNFFVSPGSGNLNLRGLATDRTLTLLDGRRLVSSTRYGGTDINTIPEEMLKDVDSVTGGASAAYGSDAIAGVVNFILDTEFTGARAHAQYGITDRGDNENWEAGFSYGTDLGDRAHLLFSGEKFEQEGVYTYADRDWYQQWGIVSGDTAAGEPTRLVRPGVTSSTVTLDGVISAPGTPLHRIEFLPDGSTQPFVLGPEGATTGAYQSHTSGPGTSGTDNSRPTLQPETSRESYFGYLDYDVTSDLTVFAQGIWGHNDTRSNNIGGFYGFPFLPIVIQQDNAFLPDDIRQTMIDNDMDSFTMYRVGSDLDTAREAATITENTMRSITLGLDWDFLQGGLGDGDWFNGWHADSYYQNAQTSYNAIQRGGVRLDRIPLALDAVDDGAGNIVCHVNIEPFVTANGGRWSDCEPLNLFGRGNASDAAVGWVTGFDAGQEIDTVLEYTDSGTTLGLRDHYISGPDKVSSGDIDQTVFEVTFDGAIWKGWGAGPISGAIGYSYREEEINQVVRIPVNPSNSADARPVPGNDATLGIRGASGFNAANSVAIQFSKVPNIRGKLSTIEYFTEGQIPVIAGQPWMQQLNVTLAARRADYTGSGEIWAWKYGAYAQITDEIRLRATQSRDIRAASLSERFDRTGGFAQPACYDPTSAAPDPDALTTCPIFIVSGGNPEVQPETADTTTIGVGYQPNWLDGFSVSVDWYNIELSDAIAALTAQQIYDECVLNGDQTLCARIEFGPDSLPVLINQSVININEAKVTGWDLEATYRRPIELFGGGESVAGRLFVGYEEENSRTNFGSPTFDVLNGVGFPDLKVTGSLTYQRGPLNLFLQERYESETNLNNLWVEGVDIDDNSVDAVWYTDFNAAYRLETDSGEWQIFGNVQNLLDEDPPVVANFANFGAAATQTGGQFDRLGRRYTMGVRFRY